MSPRERLALLGGVVVVLCTIAYIMLIQHESRRPDLTAGLLNRESGWIDVATAVEGTYYYPGLLALINSTLANAPATLPVRFHILVPHGDAHDGKLLRLLEHLYGDIYHLPPGSFNVVGFDTEAAAKLVTVYHGSVRHKSMLNYARFWLPDLLPRGVKRVFYLDCDMIVRGNVADAFRSLDDTNMPLAAVFAAPSSTYKRFFNLTDPRLESLHIDPTEITFNAGVLMVDIELWRKLDVSRTLERWLATHQQTQLWKHGSQPPLLLTFYKKFAPLDPRWNTDRLGYSKPVVTQEQIDAAHLLHWNGPKKPWNILSGRGSTPHEEYNQLWFDYYDRDVVETASRYIELPVYENI
eukprot:TRINITY_DN3345_c0_g1_i1.p1 TRINITY_DN3345_c0_g1~~TRINITY_DN3345_c0_g1_i1.p1  ORF type:complete len:352 (+),score=69.61 TRINITY_DN3345_c0_g1_i1:221-1276(+)